MCGTKNLHELPIKGVPSSRCSEGAHFLVKPATLRNTNAFTDIFQEFD